MEFTLSSRDILAAVVLSFIVLPIMLPLIIMLMHRYEELAKKADEETPVPITAGNTGTSITVFFALIFAFFHSIAFFEDFQIFFSIFILAIVFYSLMKTPSWLFSLLISAFIIFNLVNLFYYIHPKYEPVYSILIIIIDLFSVGLFINQNQFYNSLYKWDDTFSVSQDQIKAIIQNHDRLCYMIWDENKKIYESDDPVKLYYEYPVLFKTVKPFIKNFDSVMWDRADFTNMDLLSTKIRKAVRDITRRAIFLRRDLVYFILIHLTFVLIATGMHFWREM